MFDFLKKIMRYEDSIEEMECSEKNEYNEVDICNYYINELVKLGKDKNLFRIEQRSNRYLTLIYGNNDFFRVHINKDEENEWLSIAIFGENKKKYMNNELFSTQKNKNQIHWKAVINCFDDYKKFIGVAYDACNVLKVVGDEPLTEEEKKIGEFLKKIYLECGAEKEEIYYRHLNEYAEIYYFEWPTKIRFKIYKKKSNCLWLYYTEIAKELGIKCDKEGKIEFNNLDEIKLVKPYIKNRVDEMKQNRKYYSKR